MVTATLYRPLPPYLPDDYKYADEWWVFHNDFPHVGQELRRLAEQALDRGDTVVSVGELVHWLRHPEYRTYLPPVSNNYRAGYARWLRSLSPELEAAIRVRELRA